MKIKRTILTPVITFCVGLILFSGWLVLNPISVFAEEASCSASCGGGISVNCGGKWATGCVSTENSGCTAGDGRGRVETKTCADARKKPGDEDELLLD